MKKATLENFSERMVAAVSKHVAERVDPLQRDLLARLDAQAREIVALKSRLEELEQKGVLYAAGEPEHMERWQ